MKDTSMLLHSEWANLSDILCPHTAKSVGERNSYKYFKKDQFIYFPDEPAQFIYMISNGRVRIGLQLEDGKKIITAILGKGEIFGELALAVQKNRSEFAQSMEDNTTICPMSIEEMKQLIDNDRELSFKILKLIGLRLLKLERTIDLLVNKNARARILEFLKDSVWWKGNQIGNETLLSSTLTRKDIAAFTCTSRQTVSKILNELKEKNLISFIHRRILIRDLTNLK